MKEGKVKSQAGGVPDPQLRDRIVKTGENGMLSCAAAFRIAEETGREPAQVGETADLIGYKLIKCRLGLFGHPPGGKIVTPRKADDPAVEEAIRSALADGRLPCRSAWEIAAAFGIPRLAVSGICEALGIKVKPCQLGAF